MRIALITWLLAMIFVLPAEARDRVDSAQRLRFLREATGQQTSGDGFDARLDARYNVEATAERSLIAAQDAVKRKQLESSNRVDSLVSSGLSEFDFQDKFKQKDEEEEEEDLTGQVEGKIDGLVDGTESNFLTQREQDFQNIEKSRAEELARQFREEQASEEIDEDETTSSTEVDESNPYYFKPAATYAEKKHVFVNRIMLAGVEYDEAYDLIEGNTSSEEVIMDLMEDFGFTYGDARAVFASEG